MERIEATSNCHVARQGPRYIASVTKTLVMFIIDFLKGYDVGAQNNNIEKVLSHTILIGMVPPYLHNTKLLKHSQ